MWINFHPLNRLNIDIYIIRFFIFTYLRTTINKLFSLPMYVCIVIILYVLYLNYILSCFFLYILYIAFKSLYEERLLTEDEVRKYGDYSFINASNKSVSDMERIEELLRRDEKNSIEVSRLKGLTFMYNNTVLLFLHKVSTDQIHFSSFKRYT